MEDNTINMPMKASKPTYLGLMTNALGLLIIVAKNMMATAIAYLMNKTEVTLIPSR